MLQASSLGSRARGGRHAFTQPDGTAAGVYDGVFTRERLTTSRSIGQLRLDLTDPTPSPTGGATLSPPFRPADLVLSRWLLRVPVVCPTRVTGNDRRPDRS